MHCPELFREERLSVLYALIRAHPLGTLVTVGENGMEANLVPFTLIERGERGILQAHLARNNHQLDTLRQAGEALVIFQGVESYITPSWYASKAQHGKVVPTWNYTMVQARGKARVIDEAEWLRAQLEALTQDQERQRDTPWHVSDAPESFIAAQMRGIVGIEIPIDSIEGKWKVSQNRPEVDRQSVQQGLRDEQVSEEMAQLVACRGAKG